MIKSFIKKLGKNIGFVAGIALFVAMLDFLGCHKPALLEPKRRPANVPQDAIWAGGADGGAYVRCGVDISRQVNPCTIWNDYTGNIVESGDYTLTTQARAAVQAELRITAADFGGHIYLQNGLVLKRKQ
jgi:hypothetical protein